MPIHCLQVAFNRLEALLGIFDSRVTDGKWLTRATIMWRCKDRRSIMKEKTFQLKNSFLIIAVGMALVFLASSHGWAQQKRKLADALTC